jgi:hypothetical protein
MSVRALVDTGASLTIINPQIAATCKLKQTGRQKISAVGGEAGEFPEYAAAISFPGNHLPGLDTTRVVACPIIRQPFFLALSVATSCANGSSHTMDAPARSK